MKIKKEFVILGAAIIVLSLYLIFHNTNRTNYQMPVFTEISGKDISKIEVGKQGESIVLNKKSNNWYVSPEGYPVDSGKIKTMLDAIENLTVTAMVSESKNYDRYDLSDDKKITIKAWADNSLKRDFEVGKPASSYRHTFVKLSDDYRVYHARKNFRNGFDQTVENLRDKTVLLFDKTKIQKIQLTKEMQSVVFTRKQTPLEGSDTKEVAVKDREVEKTDTIWVNDNGKMCDKSVIDRLLVTLSNLSCNKYINDRKKDAFTNPVYTIELAGELADSQKHTLSIFEKTEKYDKSYPVISSGNDYPFLLTGRLMEKIMINPDKILKTP